MDRLKRRKGHENRRFDSGDFSNNGKVIYEEKNKYKRHNHKKCDLSPNSFFMNWAPQPRLQPVSQRQFTSESSVCHYSVPLSLSFEPVSLPVYPALIQPQGGCTPPLETENYFNRLKHHKKFKNRPGISKANSMIQNDPPAIFYTPKVKTGDQQDYASLPPVNCDIYTAKSSDAEAVCKRRFSDPGIGQMSSDECSSIKSDDSNSSSETAEVQSKHYYTLAEQINDLRRSNSLLKKELSETKMELETFKMQSLTWKIGCEDFKPGTLSDAVNEIRNAVKLNEEALVLKVVQMLEKNSIECKEAQEKLEEKLRAETNERLSRLEDQMQKSFQQQQIVYDAPAVETCEPPSKDKDSDVQQQIVELEREKFQLRKELQEAVAKRKTAEAATEKLERLVGILRKKINGVSLESCISDEKHILVRPLASSLEKNPFIIANNRQGQKPDIPSFPKPKISPFRGLSSENTEGPNVVLFENKENENGEVNTGNGTCGGNQMSSEASSVTAQVTITGPVTDL